jgi:hypothetical protein
MAFQAVSRSFMYITGDEMVLMELNGQDRWSLTDDSDISISYPFGQSWIRSKNTWVWLKLLGKNHPTATGEA